MLKAEKNQAGSITTVVLSGYIDDTDDLFATIGIPSGGTMLVKSSAVTKINSIGVKAWIKFFSSLTQKNIKLIFEDLGIPFVEQLNMIQNFLSGGELVSVCVPYMCAQCNNVFSKSQTVNDLKSWKFIPPDEKCPKCASPSEFDDILEEYFHFGLKNG
jgi:rubredoxin/anti-anti-sigma regulatory factor